VLVFLWLQRFFVDWRLIRYRGPVISIKKDMQKRLISIFFASLFFICGALSPSIANAAKNFNIKNNTTPIFYAEGSSGNVGVGTSTMSALLTVGTTPPGVISGALPTAAIKGNLVVDGIIYGNGSYLTDLSGSGWTSSPGKVYTTTATDNVGIGTTNPSYLLHVSGTAAGVSWTNLSDIRYKKNVQALHGSLNKVLQLRGVTYEWKNPTEGNMRGAKLGVIAQEVEEVYPQAVTTSSDGIKGVDYNALVGPLIEAVKEQQSEITTQRQEIDSLRRELDELKQKLK
jgi:hypothetical protein